jgi:hypothetical protein
VNNKTTDILTIRVFHEVSSNGLKVGLWWVVSTLRIEVQCFEETVTSESFVSLISTLIFDELTEDE